MKHLFLIFCLVLVSCSKKEFKVNFTFNQSEVQSNKTYKSDPVDLFVYANTTNELKDAIKETLSKEYSMYNVDSININNYEIVQNNDQKIVNQNTIYFNIPDIAETYRYLKMLNKVYLFKGKLTKTYVKNSPIKTCDEDFGEVGLIIKNNKVKLVDGNERLLFTFDIISNEEMEQCQNNTIRPTVASDSHEIILIRSYKYYNSHLYNSSNDSYKGCWISFLGNNQVFKNIQIDLGLEFKNELLVNQLFLKYSKNDIKYCWNCSAY